MSSLTLQRNSFGSLPKFTLEQIVGACRMCEISLDAFFRVMGVEVDDILRKEPTDRLLQPSGETQPMSEIRNLEMAPIVTMVSAARKLNVPLKALCGAFDIDIAGIPDDCSQPKMDQSVLLDDRPELDSEQPVPPEVEEKDG